MDKDLVNALHRVADSLDKQTEVLQAMSDAILLADAEVQAQEVEYLLNTQIGGTQ